MTGTTAKHSLYPASIWLYIRAHWRGDLPLVQAFWINLVLIRIGVLLLAPLTHPPVLQEYLAAMVGSVLFILAAHGAVFAWQIVGTVRTCDRFQRTTGEIIPVYGVYFGIAACLLFTLSSAFTAIQTTFVEPVKSTFSQDLERERAARYRLSVTADGSSVHLDGSFERGVTEKLEAALAQNRNVKRVVLSSSGGNIFEGRGVGRVIAERGLDTHVVGTCYSACARAFIAGRNRTLAPDARMGFHRYKLDATYPVPFVDVDTEQAEDRAYYRSRGVRDSFLDRMFDAVQPDIWVPPSALLLDAGVAHRIEPRLTQ